MIKFIMIYSAALDLLIPRQKNRRDLRSPFQFMHIFTPVMSTNSLVIYKSSAGSGKTYTLVLEYLKLVLNKPSQYRSILAITFTNKATEEMKSRIVDSLVALAGDKEPILKETIAGQTGMLISELPVKAQLVLDHILHDYSRFSVSTIDSFFSKMVRSLARELHLPLRFDLELDSDAVIRQISTMMLSDISKKPWLRNWLREYIFDKMDDSKGWVLEHEIHRIARHLFDEKYRSLFPEGNHPPNPEFINALKKIKLDFEKSLSAQANLFFQVLQHHNLTIDDLSYKKSGVAGYFVKLQNGCPPADYIPGKRFLDALESPGKWATKSSPGFKEISELAEKSLIPIAQTVSGILEKDFMFYTSIVCVLNTAHMAGIIGTLDEKLGQFRKDNEILLISDNNLMLSKAISGMDAPFIYEKSGNRFSHFMLDEFQDTSDFQWNNLLPLIQNALGSGHFTLIVGDAKQSIYRWRGGNMNLLQNEIQQNLSAFKTITDSRKLAANYRSREVIVNFNNRFFEIAPKKLGLPETSGNSHAYKIADLRQDWKKGEPGEGYVQFRFFEETREDVDEETGELIEKAKWKYASCRETLSTIKNLFAKGFEPKDICILTRGNADAKLITGYLLEHNISKIISPESMQLNRSPKIIFLINLLTYIHDRKDELALAYIVYYSQVLRGQTGMTNMHELFSANRKTKLSWLPEEFYGNLDSFKKLPLYELVEELSVLFSLNPHPDAYMQRFLDTILEFTNNNSTGISDFLEWWEENQEKESCSVIVPTGENAIRVMTIHKSKGLQFPVVIIPFADWKLKTDHRSMIWVKSELPPFNLNNAHPVRVSSLLEHTLFASEYSEEIMLSYIDNLNLFYVACTRAEEQLYVFSKKPGTRKEPGTSNGMNTFILDTMMSDPAWAEQLTAGEPSFFETGVLNGPLSIRKADTFRSITLKNWISLSWKDRLKIVINKSKISINDPELPDTSYGLLFHEMVTLITKQVDADSVITKYFTGENPDQELRFRLNHDLGAFIRFGKEYGWFDEEAEIINETELLLPDGSILRPDRLIVKGTNAIVIDYKTGVEEKYHEGQVKEYASTLSQMGFSEIKMYLVYPGLEKVVEVAA